MNVRLIIYIVLLFVSNSAFSQQSKIDSLINVVNETKDDSLKYDLVNRISFTYIFRAPEKFMPFAKKHLKSAKEVDFKNGIANLYNNIGIYYDVQGIRDSSKLYFTKALNYSKNNQLHNVHSKSLNNLGMFHWNKGEFESALPYFFDALELLNETEEDDEIREKFMSKYRSNIGLIYQEMNLFEKAITSHKIALEIRERYDIRGELPTSYTNLGICYRNLGIRDSAFFYLNKSKDVAISEGLVKEEKIAHDNLGNVYQDAGETSEAIFHYKRSIELGESVPNTANSDIITYGNLIHLLNDNNNWKQSLIAIEKAESILKDDPDAKKFGKDLYKNGAITYFNIGNTEKGETYLNQFLAIQDSTFTEENANLLAEYEAKFETQEKERQLLAERNVSQQMRLENLEKEKSITNQKNLIYLLIIGFLVLTIVGYLIYRRRQQKLKAEKQQALLDAKEENARNVITAQEKEREILARDLHDGLVQEIRLLKTELEDVSGIEKEGKEKLNKRIVNLKQDARDLAYAIMPTALRKSGLIEASRDLVNNSFSTHSISGEFFSGQDHIDVSEQIKTNVYRILQEAINNIIKHSEAKEVHVSMNQLNNMLIVTIEDDGKGFDPKQNNDSIGLKSMESRALLLDGSLDIDSNSEGTTITIRVPLNK